MDVDTSNPISLVSANRVNDLDGNEKGDGDGLRHFRLHGPGRFQSEVWRRT